MRLQRRYGEVQGRLWRTSPPNGAVGKPIINLYIEEFCVKQTGSDSHVTGDRGIQHRFLKLTWIPTVTAEYTNREKNSSTIPMILTGS